MASTATEPDALSGADEDPNQASVKSSNPCGKTTPLKRRSDSSSPSTFSPSQAPPAAASDHPLLSGGYRVLQLPTGSNNLGSPAEALNRGSPIFQKDLPRRSSTPSPVRASYDSAQMLPPAFPYRRLARSSSDPVPLTHLQNAVLSTQEKDSGRGYLAGPRTDPNSPRGSFGNVSGLYPPQEAPSPKRLKRLDQIQRIKRMKQLVDEMVQEDERCDGFPTKTDISSDKSIMEGGGEAEEDVVSAEREGDSTHLKLKCSCGSGFDVVIIGQCCFYKLI